MGRTQIINATQMYLDHYALFEEPDHGIPSALWISGATKLPDFTWSLHAPIAVQHFSQSGATLTETSRFFKTMAYQIAPAGLAPPIPPQVIDFFSTLLFRPVAPSEITPLMVAVGQFDLPPPASVTGTLSGSTFTVTKQVSFRVQIQLGFLYAPLHLGLMSPYVTNQQAADGLSIPVPPGVDPAAPLAYTWGAPMTLSTGNSFVEPVASLPPAFADPFDPSVTEVRLEGKPVDAEGRYKIVGSTTGVVPISSVPQILQVLFGTLTPVCRFAYAEEGVLLPL